VSHRNTIDEGNRPGSSSSLAGEKFPALTGLRGIAAFGVFLCHFQPIALQTLGLKATDAQAVVANGFRGVDLFFVLSGFILLHAHHTDFDRITRDKLARFYVLRFFRIYPLNTAVLLCLLPLPFFLPEFVDWHRMVHLSQGAYHVRDFSLLGFIQSLCLAQTWTFIKPGTWNEPTWTLSAEVAGYCLFPFLAWRILRVRSAAGALISAGSGLALFAVLMTLGGHARNNPSGIFGLVRMASCFVAGMFFYRLYQLVRGHEGMWSILSLMAVASIALTFSISVLGTLSVFGFGLLILSLAYETGPVHAALVHPIVVFLGRISFSFYILHLIPLEAAQQYLL
jgi:peptidoglycan/LPS O-acetylase OafA/YrhL